MKTRKVLIADDEILTRKRIRALIETFQYYEVIAEASTGQAALDLIKIHQPDVILLDISMPVLSGLEILKRVDKSNYKILVFITAHDEFALQAFENEALDYLLKPFDKDRFSTLLDRIDKQLNLLDPIDNSVIIAKHQGINHRIEKNRILYIRANDNYIELHTGQESYKTRGSLKAISHHLDASFVRIHRSTIVNKNEVRSLQHLTQGDYLIQMSDGKKLTSSKSYRGKVQTLLG